MTKRILPSTFISLFSWIAMAVFLWAGTAAGAPGDIPAEYVGEYKSCPQLYPGAFLDIGLGECYSCPNSHPNRTIFSVRGGEACERPASTQYRAAAGPQSPTGWPIATNCSDGYFLDVGLGKCYKCPANYGRTVRYSVESNRACSRRIGVSRTSATYRGEPCADGSFRHFISESCYRCPEGSYRNANTGTDPTQFGACTVCGGEGQRGCPVTTLRDACDEGLQQTLALRCEATPETLLIRAAEDKLAEIGEEVLSRVNYALDVSSDPEIRNGLSDPQGGNAGAVEAEANTALNPCLFDAKQTWTLGLVADAKAGIGAGIEGGVAIDISEAARQNGARPVFAYGGVEYSFQLGAGGSGGVNYGCWVAANNDLGGNYWGLVFDTVTLVQTVKAGKPSFEWPKGVSPSVLIGIWFSPDSGRFDPVNDYLGFTITPVLEKEIDLAGTAVIKGVTGQVTGVFPPPIGEDLVFQSYYQFDDESGTVNEFVMQGPNRVQVRNLRCGASASGWSTYLRKGEGFLSDSPNVFKSTASEATYTIAMDERRLAWAANNGSGNVIDLVPVLGPPRCD